MCTPYTVYSALMKSHATYLIPIALVTTSQANSEGTLSTTVTVGPQDVLKSSTAQFNVIKASINIYMVITCCKHCCIVRIKKHPLEKESKGQE